MKREKLHSHPSMQKRLGVDKDHVIVDRAAFEQCMLEDRAKSFNVIKKMVISKWEHLMEFRDLTEEEQKQYENIKEFNKY